MVVHLVHRGLLAYRHVLTAADGHILDGALAVYRHMVGSGIQLVDLGTASHLEGGVLGRCLHGNLICLASDGNIGLRRSHGQVL